MRKKIITSITHSSTSLNHITQPHHSTNQSNSDGKRERDEFPLSMKKRKKRVKERRKRYRGDYLCGLYFSSFFCSTNYHKITKQVIDKDYAIEFFTELYTRPKPSMKIKLVLKNIHREYIFSLSLYHIYHTLSLTHSHSLSF
jgi:hypothetical protein